MPLSMNSSESWICVNRLPFRKKRERSIDLTKAHRKWRAKPRVQSQSPEHLCCDYPWFHILISNGIKIQPSRRVQKGVLIDSLVPNHGLHCEVQGSPPCLHDTGIREWMLSDDLIFLGQLLEAEREGMCVRACVCACRVSHRPWGMEHSLEWGWVVVHFFEASATAKEK